MKTVTVIKSVPLILVDASYYVFYRYFATLRWYSFQVEEVNHSELHQNSVFLEALQRHITSDIMKWRKKYSVFRNNVLFCLDSPRKDIWRCDLYPEYKGTRTHAATFNSNVFGYVYEMFKTQGEFLGMDMIEGNRLEADDIVYITKTHLRELGFDQLIHIITNDNDYLQMKDDTVTICNLQGKGADICTRGQGDPSLDLMIKILKGDTSDNIQPIYPKLGPSTALKIAKLSDTERMAWLQAKGQECVRKFELNKKLISFIEIPVDLIESFKTSINWNIE